MKMNLKLRIKLLIYRIATSSLGKILLRPISTFVRIDGDSKSNQKHPFIIVITTDTEAGYVDKNERRIWQHEAPEASIGYTKGISNLMEVFERHSVNSTFFLCTHCFSFTGEEKEKIVRLLKDADKKGHEIGLHLHPDTDKALQDKLSKKFKATSAFFLDLQDKKAIISGSKELIEENLGKSIGSKLKSIRWGNWALDADGVKAIKQNGLKIDSSATPGIKGHPNDGRRFEWDKVKTHYPWKLNLEDHQKTELDGGEGSGITEIPIATFNFFGNRMRADPVNSLLLNHAFLEYYKEADRFKKPFVFVVITHSSEATYKDGRPTHALKDLDSFIEFSKKMKNVKYMSLESAEKTISS